MIGHLNPADKNVTVIGAGISGLLAAYYLDKQGYKVTLIEKDKKAGGLISTSYTPFGMCEAAAHSLLASPPVVRLAGELGLTLTPVNKNSKARYIMRDGKMRRIPLSLGELSTAAFRALFVKAKIKEDNLYQWGLTHLGEPAITWLLSAFLVGVYGTTPKETSLEAAFPLLVSRHGETLRMAINKNRKAKGVVKAKKPMSVFLEGMGSLTQALESHLKKCLKKDFRLGTTASKLPTKGNIVLAVPAPAAAQLLAKHDKNTAQALKQVRYNPFIAATVFLEKEKMKTNPRGVGVLFPEKEQSPFLGILFNSSSFEGRVNGDGFVSMTIMMGGSVKPEIVSKGDAQIKKIIKQELQSLFGAGEAIASIRIARHTQGIPAYNDTILKVRENALSGWAGEPGRVLFGNYTGDISLRGMIEAANKI